MVMESSTREVWVSYQTVCYQEIPRFDAGADDYPEDTQTALSRHLVNQQHEYVERPSVSYHETVISALGNFPSTKPIELTA